ncbi:hypothetical protein [Streptomyces bungoensis]|uniref:hypothetical protein n=1 Tax=Streptomyces bungoensis TaxID=285568 RepID=UPI00341329DD
MVQRLGWSRKKPDGKPDGKPAAKSATGALAAAAAATVAGSLAPPPASRRADPPPPPYQPAGGGAPPPAGGPPPPGYEAVPPGAFDPRELTDFQLDELVHRIIGRVTRLIRTELRLDRERIGKLRDPRR